MIAEEDRYKTAFVLPHGHYEWNVMPMGLAWAPIEFQEWGEGVFFPYQDFILVYIDDLLVFSKTMSDHIQHL